MLEQLKELLRMQRTLDFIIFNEHKISEYPIEQVKLALFDELGELLHEFPTKYKYWKKTAVDNREKGLEEYVDCLHFALSLSNFLSIKESDVPQYEMCVINNESLLDMIEKMINDVSHNQYILMNLFVIGNYFGFTWEEIYSAYKKKNAVNYERLKGGY